MYRKHPRNANRLDNSLGCSSEFLHALLPSQWLRPSRRELVRAFILSGSLGLANLRLDQQPSKDHKTVRADMRRIA